MPNPVPDRWQRIDTLFAHALDLPPAERDAFLREACPDGEERAAVLRLLAASEEAADFLAGGAAGWAGPDLAEALGEATADAVEYRRLGPWRLVREVGRGGMSVVWLAERADGAFEQEVAVKLLHPGGPAPHLARRLEAERRILAGLDHPHIARVLDGGVAPDGRPYLVMEYVEGTPLDAYAARHALSIEARLRLFLQVCDAVAYAHRRLVVHRDLKPPNVLVAEDDPPAAGGRGRPRAKLLDFGIATLLEEEPGPAATQTAARWLTPAYAAPEQVRGEPVTTATDVWALGVLLYELLAGRRPFGSEGETRHALERAILDAEPPRPSAVAADGRRLRGDLDAVVLKALRKEPEARYAGADALADDVRRHLDGRTVAARRGTLGYRAAAFARRHRWGVAAGAGLVVLLAGFTGAMARQRAQTDRERDRAALAGTFLLDLLRSPDPLAVEPLGPDVTVRTFLDAAVERAQTDLADEPALRYDLLDAVTDVHKNLGAWDEAHATAALNLRLARGVFPERSREVAGATAELGWATHGQGDYEEAEPLLRQALALTEAVHGPDAPETASLLNDLGMFYRAKGDMEAGEQFSRRAVVRYRSLGDEARGDLATALQQWAGSLRTLERYDEAIAATDEGLALRRSVSGDRHPKTAMALVNAAHVYSDAGDTETAERLNREALSVLTETLGETHEVTLTAANNLAVRLDGRGEHAEAEALYRRVLAARRVQGDGTSESVGDALQNLAVAVRDQGRPGEAADLHHEAMAVYEATLPPGHPKRAFPALSLADLEVRRGRYAEAEAQARAALGALREALPEGHFATLVAEGRLGRALAGQGRDREAEPLLRASHERLLASRGADDEFVQEMGEALAALEP